MMQPLDGQVKLADEAVRELTIVSRGLRNARAGQATFCEYNLQDITTAPHAVLGRRVVFPKGSIPSAKRLEKLDNIRRSTGTKQPTKKQ